MKIITTAIIVLTLVSLRSANSQDRTGSAKQADSEESIMLYDASIQMGAGGYLEATLDLGSLPAGRKFPARLRLRNSTDSTLPIRSMTTTCGCLKVKSLTDEFLPGGFVDCEMSVDVPQQATDLVQRIMFTIYYDGTRGVTVRMNYQIAGLATFSAKAFVTKIPLGKRKHVFQIPILISPPTQLDEIKILPDESLGIMEIEPVKVGGAHFLNCSLVLEDNEHGRDGMITLVAPDGKTTGRLSCVVSVEQPVSFAPSMLRFVPEVDEEGYKASAIVRIHESLLVFPNDKSPLEKKPSFKLIGSKEDPVYETKSRRIAKGVYRLTIAATSVGDPEIWTKVSRTVRLVTRTGKESISREVQLSFRDRR